MLKKPQAGEIRQLKVQQFIPPRKEDSREVLTSTQEITPTPLKEEDIKSLLLSIKESISTLTTTIEAIRARGIANTHKLDAIWKEVSIEEEDPEGSMEEDSEDEMEEETELPQKKKRKI